MCVVCGACAAVSTQMDRHTFAELQQRHTGCVPTHHFLIPKAHALKIAKHKHHTSDFTNANLQLVICVLQRSHRSFSAERLPTRKRLHLLHPGPTKWSEMRAARHQLDSWQSRRIVHNQSLSATPKTLHCKSLIEFSNSTEPNCSE